MDCDPTFAFWHLSMVFVFGCNALSELSIYIVGICAPFLITFSSVGNENSDGGKASAPDYISVCLLFIFIIVGNI